MPSLLRTRPRPRSLRAGSTVDLFHRLDVRWTAAASATMAHLVGVLDAEAAPELRAIEVVASADVDVVIDLTDVAAADVRGLDLLERVAEAPNVRLYAMPSHMVELLDRTAGISTSSWPVVRAAALDTTGPRAAVGSTAVSERIRLHVGPADVVAARDWVANRQALVDASRRAPELDVKPEVLDLLDMILGLWASEAERAADAFEWSHDLDADVLLLIGKYWLDLGDLTPDERAALGVPAAPAHTERFTLAVVDGMVAALRTIGEPANPLLQRLGLA